MEVRLTVARTFRPGSSMTAVGALESRCHVQLAGDGSALPAGSIARI